MPSNTQSIIVYRNPLEKAVWEGDYSTTLVPIACGVIASAVFYIIAFKLLDKVQFKLKRKYYNMLTNSIFAMGAIIGVLVTKHMWL